MQTGPAHHPTFTRFSSRSLLWPALGLVVVLLLYADEVANYRHFLLGTKEYHTARDLNHHPGCQIVDGNPRELLCPVRAYNSIRLDCLTDQCVYRDADAPAVTPQAVEAFRRREMAEFGKMPKRQPSYDEVPK